MHSILIFEHTKSAVLQLCDKGVADCLLLMANCRAQISKMCYRGFGLCLQGMSSSLTISAVSLNFFNPSLHTEHGS